MRKQVRRMVDGVWQNVDTLVCDKCEGSNIVKNRMSGIMKFVNLILILCTGLIWAIVPTLYCIFRHNHVCLDCKTRFN